MDYRRDVQIKIQPWFRDHSYDGRPVLPAVESLLVLAKEVSRQYSDLDVREMTEARFARFLEIPVKEQYIDAVIELPKEGGIVRAGLYSRKKAGRFFRQVEHAAVCFGASGKVNGQRLQSEEQPFVVFGERMYKELVPFGPAYQNVTEAEIFTTGVRAKIQTPELPLAQNCIHLGSPFLLDSALHAACVWGQRFADFVPFPVGFSSRRIVAASLPGQEFRADIRAAVVHDREINVDIDITETGGRLVEQVQGVVMRDVSGGQMQPPAWIRQNRL